MQPAFPHYIQAKTTAEMPIISYMIYPMTMASIRTEKICILGVLAVLLLVSESSNGVPLPGPEDVAAAVLAVPVELLPAVAVFAEVDDFDADVCDAEEALLEAADPDEEVSLAVEVADEEGDASLDLVPKPILLLSKSKTV